MKLTKWIINLFRPTKRCTVCGRKLTTAKDRARGMGAGCWKKTQGAKP